MLTSEKTPMMTMLGSPRRCCDGLTRRETLTAGALTFLGGAFNLPSLLAAENSRSPYLSAGKAKSVILLNLIGGAATQDMYDLKPNAPEGIRSEFRPMSTNVPGIQICEHLPRTAQWMHRTALIRTVNHAAGCHNCLPCYTGCQDTRPDLLARDTDPPSIGSVCEHLNTRRGPDELPAYVYMPNRLGLFNTLSLRLGGPYGGFLGRRYDPFTTECQPYMDPVQPTKRYRPTVVRGVPYLPSGVLPAEITVDRFNQRVSLLRQIDAGQRRLDNSGVVQTSNELQQRAFSLLAASKLREAFDLSKEPARITQRYGNTLFGNSALLARRLVERGVRFVNVSYDSYSRPVLIDAEVWDTHQNNFTLLKDNKLPIFDQVYSALLEDLESRGLLDETLVFVTSEMGRTPRVNAQAGRDHWTHCYGSMLAGAGIKGGTVVGTSDSQAAFVHDRPVSTTEICATIYELLGINPEMLVHDRSGRPFPVALGAQPVRELLA